METVRSYFRICDVATLENADNFVCKVRQDSSKVLSLFCPGLKLRGQVGFTLLCKRCCQVQVFWSKGANSFKLEQSEDVRLFSYLNMWSHIACGEFVNDPFCDIKLPIGKNPKRNETSPNWTFHRAFPKLWKISFVPSNRIMKYQ